MRSVETEAGDNEPAWFKMMRDAGHHPRQGAGREERDDIAREEDGVERATGEVHGRQIRDLEFGDPIPGHGNRDHRWVRVDAHASIAECGEPGRHPTGAAPGVDLVTILATNVASP